MVARRIGEKDPEKAAKAGAQVILVGIVISILISIAGIFFAGNFLRLMGATPEIIETGSAYTRIMYRCARLHFKIKRSPVPV